MSLTPVPTVRLLLWTRGEDSPLKPSHSQDNDFAPVRRCSPGRRCARSLLFAICVYAGLAQCAFGDGRVPEAHIDSRVVRFPVIDGNDIRFTRLSTSEGLSQTRVAHVIGDDLGFMWFGTQYG